MALVFVQSHRNVQLGYIHGPPVASRFAASVAPAASLSSLSCSRSSPLLARSLPPQSASSGDSSLLGVAPGGPVSSNSIQLHGRPMGPYEPKGGSPAHPPNGLPAAAVRSRRAPTTQSWGEKWLRGNPCHICIGTRLTSATSAPGLGSHLPHLRRDWAHPCHICAGDWAYCCHICAGDWAGLSGRRGRRPQARASRLVPQQPCPPRSRQDIQPWLCSGRGRGGTRHDAPVAGV